MNRQTLIRQLKKADLFTSGQITWCEEERQKEKYKKFPNCQICKLSLDELHKPRTRLILCLLWLAAAFDGAQFSQMLTNLVIMSRLKRFHSSVKWIRHARKQLTSWEHLTPYQKAMFIAAGTIDGVKHTYHITLAFSPSVQQRLSLEPDPLRWVSNRIRTSLRGLSRDVALILSIETCDDFWHCHMLLVCDVAVDNKERLRACLKPAGGKDWPHGRGYAQVRITSVSDKVEAMKACNYQMKEGHDYYVSQSLTRRAKHLHSDVRNALSHVVKAALEEAA